MKSQDIKNNKLNLLPCAPDVCQECAVKHDLMQPHNAQSLYYQFKFYSCHQRYPTWKDAVSHCDKQTQKLWEAELIKLGKWK